MGPSFWSGESSSSVPLLSFPTQLLHMSFTEHWSYQIRHAPIPEAMTFNGRAGDEVSFVLLVTYPYLLSSIGLMILLFPSQVLPV